MAFPFKRVGWSAREELLSTDLLREESLWSKAVQDELKWGSLDSTATPINCFTQPPTLTGIGGGFTMTLSDGEALVQSAAGVTADDSDFAVLAWQSLAPLAFGVPDGVNARIDLVVASLFVSAEDVQTRNFLVNPSPRTIAPASTAKTLRPQAVVTVVAGTPGGTPAPPAVPVGTFALFEVLVPAAAADATAFVTHARLWRRAPYPWTNLSGVLQGVNLRWTQVNPAGASAVLSVGTGNVAQPHKVLIDGEVVEHAGTIPIFQDAGAASPFAAAATAGVDKPYYIYVVGGRHAPQGASAAFFPPLAVVESLVSPNTDTGHPNSAITHPRGGTTVLGAVFVGLGWVYRGTTNRRTVMVSGGWAFAAGGSFESVAATTLALGANAFPVLGSAPSAASGGGSQGVIAELRCTSGGGAHVVWVSPQSATPEAATTSGAPLVVPAASFGATQARLWYDGTAAFEVNGGVAGDSMSIFPTAYQIRAIRFDGQAFQ